ncbi:TPA: hypothetical protein ACYEM7_001956 [Klebsiella pneumoniae]|uniref:hypothetical protein n=1 Tax=Klebsiella pneumoniae TaxID=573 RepID=UPI00058D93B2|nr:hypothetical protein [Klebsiella pneumoniae]HEP0362471.1 hypothetical protein [Klebsiella pneumoniae subsp. pneumoniae]EKX9391842.1 hypothetical protein [Klebsiella pneumoniae]MCB3531091.1 hypothetical protein [Klebsiella pneumoniae]MED6015049.1 hypothetical protein [Klebsiella pneumoniae]SLV96275.1 Uncharacterised protein [Klebsiella pneumoniae]
MNKSTSIGKLVKKALIDHKQNDMNSALINIMPAIDSTANKEYGGGVGHRIRSFIRKNEALISIIALGRFVILPKFRYPGKTKSVDFADIIYDNIRTYIVHEGEVGEMIEFNHEKKLAISLTKWSLNENYVLAFILCVIVSDKNANEFIAEDVIINLNFGCFSVNDLWGRRLDLLHHIANNSNGQYRVENSNIVLN